MKDVFTIDDLVLPTLKLPDPCPIRIEIRDECVYLYVGQRDWQWRLSNGKLVGSGCGLCCTSVSAPPPPQQVQSPEGQTKR